MNHFLILCGMFGISSFAIGMDKKITVRSASRLHGKFEAAELKDFAENSRLIEKIGGKECSIKGLDFAIRASVIDYQNSLWINGKDISRLETLELRVKRVIFGKNFHL